MNFTLQRTESKRFSRLTRAKDENRVKMVCLAEEKMFFQLSRLHGFTTMTKDEESRAVVEKTLSVFDISLSEQLFIVFSFSHFKSCFSHSCDSFMNLNSTPNIHCNSRRMKYFIHSYGIHIWINSISTVSLSFHRASNLLFCLSYQHFVIICLTSTNGFYEKYM